jgi:hypothetical protein
MKTAVASVVVCVTLAFGVAATPTSADCSPFREDYFDCAQRQRDRDTRDSNREYEEKLRDWRREQREKAHDAAEERDRQEIIRQLEELNRRRTR